MAVKVKFERPDRRMRRRIWRKLIPECMPLADDAGLDKLAGVPKTGGSPKTPDSKRRSRLRRAVGE